jgi:hypothetical protein
MAKYPPIPRGQTPHPRFKIHKSPNDKINFADWFKPMNEAVHRGLNFASAQVDDTTAIITAATMFERFLSLAIILKFGRHPSETEMSSIFDYPGPMSSFAAKINVAHLQGYLTDDMKHDLDIIRDIRNRFCHSYFKRTFADVDIAQKCGLLKYGSGDGSHVTLDDIKLTFNRFEPLGRAQFTVASLMLLLILMYTFYRKFEEIRTLNSHQKDIVAAASTRWHEMLDELGKIVKAKSEQGAQPPPKE